MAAENLGAGFRWPRTGLAFTQPLSPYRAAAISFVFAAATIFLQYPGIVGYDGIVVWYEARHLVHFSQHPVALALLVHGLDAILPGPGLFSIIEVSLLWLAVWGLLIARPMPVWRALLFCTVLFLLPPVMQQEANLAKDAIGAHLTILACVFALVAHTQQRRVWLWPLCFALLGLAMVLRYQFGIVILPLGLWMAWSTESGRQFLMAPWLLRGLVAFILTATCVEAVAWQCFTMQKVDFLTPDHNFGTNDISRSLRKLLVFDIAGTVHFAPAAALPVFAGDGVDVAALKTGIKEHYSPTEVDALWQNGGDVFKRLAKVSNADLWKQWFGVISNAPLAFAEHRTAAFVWVLRGCGDPGAGIARVPASLAQDLDASSYRPALVTPLLDNPAYPKALLTPLLYALAALTFLGLSIRDLPRHGGTALLTASGLVYELTFFALPQSCTVRYSYFLTLAALFGAAMFVAEGIDSAALPWTRRRNSTPPPPSAYSPG